MKQLISKDLVTIFEGSQVEALVLQVALQVHGFFTYIPSQAIKAFYPLWTGAGMFNFSLQVPADQVREALKTIQEIRAVEVWPGQESFEEQGPVSQAEKAGVRVRWCGIIITLFPQVPYVGWVLAAGFLVVFVCYLLCVHRLKVKPRAHLLNLSSLGIMVFFVLNAVLFEFAPPLRFAWRFIR
jgi:hypothetical protein